MGGGEGPRGKAWSEAATYGGRGAWRQGSE